MINFKKINIVLENEIVTSSLKVTNGKIESIGSSSDEQGFDFSDYYLVPGFIDQHIHGSAGFDIMDGTLEAFDEMSKSLLKEGTTSFLGTTITQSFDNIEKTVHLMADAKVSGANLVGVHLEGPFLNKVFKGAQPEQYIIPTDVKMFDKWNKYKNIKIISMAAEVDEDFKLIKHCSKNNIIVSQAHTNATYDISRKAIDNGAKGFTHAYNAMSKLHHRDIGVVGNMLLNNDAYAELICDGIHVSKDAVRLLYKNKGRENIILITDSMRAKYLPDGKSELGGQEVFVKNNEARLADGTLAGSILKMNDGVRNMIEFANVSLVDAVYMASTNPAKNLGLDTKGSIKSGFDADLTVLNKDLEVVMTIVNGKIVYEKELKK
ncbi:N-acetylglucosamine-6-phosphate deacetylase [Haploplasma modicum]|uniref:N-acetylglucosamine-6-phosphate deacetylase n=1 Tax=Haploplasma modicum TaxID=2150 RepID=UPI00214B6736|nr:N-acetylglucosamine-6-phosphate deacetylase [Haploplasma modicum]MCR1808697.1 N-acetylglucosamine-6-phosphate deacetylase [Haploplasma modicum]